MVIEDITSCQTIAEIIRGIVYLNDAETLEMMVKNADTFVRVAGAMELDPLLQEPGRFKEALLRTPRGPPCIVGENFGCGGEKNDLGYEGATEKEHQGTTGRGGGGRAADLVTKLFRVRLLRDSLIRPLPDESGAAALNTMLCSLQSAVCDEIFNDTLYLQKILRLVESPDFSASADVSRQNLSKDVEEDYNDGESVNDSINSKPASYLTQIRSGLCFLRELFFMSRQLSLEQRSELYSNCLNELRIPFFSALRNTLCMRDGETLTGRPLPSSGIETVQEVATLREPNISASSIRVMAAEILSSVTHVCPSFLRQTIIEGAVPTPPSYCVSSSGGAGGNDNDRSILYVIIERICCDEEASVTEHLGESVKVLLDPERMDKLEKDRFLALFYDYYVHWMLVPFAHDNTSPDEICRINTPHTYTESSVKDLASSATADHVNLDGAVNNKKQQDEVMAASQSMSPSAQQNQNPSASKRTMPASDTAPIPQDHFSAISSSRRFLCEIFSQCACNHFYRMKFFIVRNNVISRILKLLRSRHKHMHIGAVKFIRAILSVKDEFYYKHIVKYDILKPMFDLFTNICMKDNLITSAIVEVMDFIRTERIVTLIYYIVEKYRFIFTICLGESEETQEGREEEEKEKEKGTFVGVDMRHSEDETVSASYTSQRQQQQQQPWRTQGVGKLLHVEVFQKFLHTYEQVVDADSTISRSLLGPAPQQAHESGAHEVGLTRKLMNKNLAEIESEEAYFLDVDDADDDDRKVKGNDNADSNEEEYGPFLNTMPPSSFMISSSESEGRKNVLKRSYFADFDCGRPPARGEQYISLGKEVQVKNHQLSKREGNNSLKLISDMYGDEDDGDEAEGDSDYSTNKTKIIRSDIIHNENDTATRFCHSPPPPDLPPLKSKFEQDSDGSETGSNRFFQNKRLSRGGVVIAPTGRNGSDKERENESDSLPMPSNGQMPSSISSSGGVKFSMKKKKV